MKFKDKINQLNDFTLNQEKFNSLISELITNMNLDENLDEEEKISVSPKNLSDADLMLNETLLILGDWLDNISTNKISNEETVITQID